VRHSCPLNQFKHRRVVQKDPSVVAERLGFHRDTALTLGRAVAGLNAYAKGVSLGLFKPSSKALDEHLKKAKTGATPKVGLLNRAIPVVRTPDGLRALSKDRPISSASVERYLQSKFGENLGSVRRAMEELAHSLPRRELAVRAYYLYEQPEHLIVFFYQACCFRHARFIHSK
jgi:hypothetical protein